MEQFKASMYALIVETSTNLPPDVRRAILAARERETPGTQSMLALETIALNVDLACDGEAPICQDTGMPTFYIHTPVGVNQLEVRADRPTLMAMPIRDATADDLAEIGALIHEQTV